MEKEFSPLCCGHWLLGYTYANCYLSPTVTKKTGIPKTWERDYLGREGSLGVGGNGKAMRYITHVKLLVSSKCSVTGMHAQGCGLGPGLLTDVLRFKAGECTSCQPLPSPSLRLCPATLQLHRPPSPKAHKPVLLCVLSLPAPSKDRKARPTCCSWL